MNIMMRISSVLLTLASTCVPALAGAPRVGIVGGGISGAATAHFLSELLPDAQIDVHESEPHIGGRAHTLSASVFGVPLDAG